MKSCFEKSLILLEILIDIILVKTPPLTRLAARSACFCYCLIFDFMTIPAGILR